MPVTFGTPQLANSTSSATHTCTLPTYSVGDFLFLNVMWRGANVSFSSISNDWQIINSDFQQQTVSTTIESAIFYKIAGASESAPVVTLDATPTNTTSLIIPFSGTIGLDLLFANGGSGFSTTRTAPSVDTVTNNAYWISFCHHDNSTVGPATQNATGTTLIYNTPGVVNGGWAFYGKEITPVGATGSNTFTVTASEIIAAGSIVLKPYYDIPVGWTGV